MAFLGVTREGCVLILARSPSCVPTSAAILTVDIFLQLVVCWLPDALPGERAALCSLVPIRQSTSIQAMNCGCEMVIANGSNATNLYDILDGKDVGTKFMEVQ